MRNPGLPPIVAALIARYVGLGVSGNLIQIALREAGLGLRRASIQAEIRRLTGLGKLQRVVEALGAFAPIPRYAMVQTELKQPYQYLVYGKYQVYYPSTGQYETRPFRYYADVVESKATVADEFIAHFDFERYGLPMEIVSAEVLSIEHQRGAPY